MSVPLSRRWAEALRLVLKRVYDPTTRVPVPWYLSGETSLNLQGVSIDPDPVGLALRATSTRRARFENLDVAVIPLEYSLAEAALRSQLELTQRILHTLRTMGHDPAELRRALAPVPQEKASRIQRSLEFNVLS